MDLTNQLHGIFRKHIFYKRREPESKLFTFIISLLRLLSQHYEGSEHLCANIFLFPRKMTSENFTGIISIYLIGASWKYPLTFMEFFEFFKWKTLHKSNINTFKKQHLNNLTVNESNTCALNLCKHSLELSIEFLDEYCFRFYELKIL